MKSGDPAAALAANWWRHDSQNLRHHQPGRRHGRHRGRRHRPRFQFLSAAARAISRPERAAGISTARRRAARRRVRERSARARGRNRAHRGAGRGATARRRDRPRGLSRSAGGVEGRCAWEPTFDLSRRRRIARRKRCCWMGRRAIVRRRGKSFDWRAGCASLATARSFWPAGWMLPTWPRPSRWRIPGAWTRARASKARPARRTTGR